jgi:GTP-binding protein HflX
MHVVKTRETERALLVGLERGGHQRWEIKDSLEELNELARTAGAEVVDTVIQRLPQPTPNFFIGKGKAEEIAQVCNKHDVVTVIFDDDLSPAQSRNLERVFNCKIIDRTELILDIFAQRAHTREGKLQIELAQLQYLLPRLTRLWTHLSRQSGGIGTRGPGETQLEVDRRRVQEKIARLTREIAEVQKNRRIQRAGRRRHQWPIAAIIGYTNAGKSTLLNSLTGSSVLAEDKLFATLDPTTRRFTLPNNQDILLTDTVGFLRKLPHHLIDSFKATLEEVVEADLLIHVVDMSHPKVNDQIAAVEQVLHELHAWGKPTVTALNKVDRLTEPNGIIARFQAQIPNSTPISARTKFGFESLLLEIQTALANRRRYAKLTIPQQNYNLVAEVFRLGQIISQKFNNGNVQVEARIPPALREQLRPFLMVEDERDAAVSH